MRQLINRYKRELFYTVIIFVIWELSLIPSILGNRSLFWMLTLLGFVMLIAWLITNYYRFAHREISRYTEVLIKIDLKQRFFTYFVTPVLLYISVSLYLYGVKNMFLKQLILLIAVMTLYLLMLHIRASYEKVFSLERSTRFVFQLVDLVMFYIGVTGFVLLGTTLEMRVLGTSLVGFLLLAHQLLINKQYSQRAFFVLALSVVFIGFSAVLFVGFNAVAFPLFMSIIFYLIVSLWGIKLNGVINLSDYLPPLLFSLMAFMVLLSF